MWIFHSDWYIKKLINFVQWNKKERETFFCLQESKKESPIGVLNGAPSGVPLKINYERQTRNA